MKEKSVVLSLSGGMDSGTLLGYFVECGYPRIKCVNFQYGSKHNPYELEMAKKLARNYGIKDLQIIDMTTVFSAFASGSALIASSNKQIPHGHYEDLTMKQTVVPQRNMLFATILAGIAETLDISYICMGVHAGDHSIYPDCRAEFIKSLDTTIYLSTDRKVEIIAPFQYWDKTKIIKYGLSIDFPYQLTRTCYENSEQSCGKCGSCVERLEAFKNNGIEDPIEYK